MIGDSEVVKAPEIPSRDESYLQGLAVLTENEFNCIYPTILEAMRPENAERDARIALCQLDCWAKVNGAGLMKIVMKYMWDILMEILTDLICAGPEHMIWRQFCVFNDQTFGPGRSRFSVRPGFPNVQGSNDVDLYGDRNERNGSSKREDQTGYSIPPYRKPELYAEESPQYAEMMSRPGVAGADFSRPPIRPGESGRQSATTIARGCPGLSRDVYTTFQGRTWQSGACTGLIKRYR